MLELNGKLTQAFYRKRQGPTMSKQLLGLSILLVALSLLFSCDQHAPLRIGFSGQLTGPRSDLGVQGRNGAELAVEDINAKGGIGGRDLELVAKDDLDTAEGAREADALLAESGCLAIIGHMTSGQTLAALPVTAAKKIPLISPTTAAPSLEGKRDTFFRLIPTNTRWAVDLATYARSQGLGRAFLVGDSSNTGYTDTFLDTFQKRFVTAGGTVVGTLLFPSATAQNWKQLCTNIIATKPDVLIVCTSARELAALAQELRATKSTLRIMAPAWPSTRELILTAGKDAEGIAFVSSYTEDNTYPPFVRFREHYRERFGWYPNFAAAFAYESVLVLAKALEQTYGKRAGLEEALANGPTFEGVIGPFSLDATGDVVRPNFISQVRGGEFVTLGDAGTKR